MSRYSNDLRSKVVNFHKATKLGKRSKTSKTSTCNTFGISRPTLNYWLKLDTQGKLLEETDYHHGFISKIDPEKLKDYVEANPDRYNHEIAKEFSVSKSQIQRFLTKLKITVKKNKQPTEKQMKKLS